MRQAAQLLELGVKNTFLHVFPRAAAAEVTQRSRSQPPCCAVAELTELKQYPLTMVPVRHGEKSMERKPDPLTVVPTCHIGDSDHAKRTPMLHRIKLQGCAVRLDKADVLKCHHELRQLSAASPEVGVRVADWRSLPRGTFAGLPHVDQTPLPNRSGCNANVASAKEKRGGRPARPCKVKRMKIQKQIQSIEGAIDSDPLAFNMEVVTLDNIFDKRLRQRMLSQLKRHHAAAARAATRGDSVDAVF